jgi:hypothetical protein
MYSRSGKVPVSQASRRSMSRWESYSSLPFCSASNWAMPSIYQLGAMRGTHGTEKLKLMRSLAL